MQKTKNYQLCQWAASDRILMADFNNDNAKIEAALTGLAAADAAEQSARTAQDTALAQQISQLKASIPLVKLADVTAAANQTVLTVDVSQIDLSQFAEIRMLCYFGCGTSPISLSYNETIAVAGSDYYLCQMDVSSTFAYWKHSVRLLPYAGIVHCVCERLTESSDRSLQYRMVQADPADIHSLIFQTSGGLLNPESRVVMWGLRL